MTQIPHWSSGKYSGYFKGLLWGFNEIAYIKHTARFLALGECSKCFIIIIIIIIILTIIIRLRHSYSPQIYTYFPKLLLILHLGFI